MRAKKSELESNKRDHNFAKRVMSDQRVFAIIGGGPSGAVCAETLRSKGGFTGRIVLISNEEILPYDRPKLSKAMDAKPKAVQLRKKQFYDEHHIEVLTGVSATSLNFQNKEIMLDNGNKIKFDKVYIATGSTARRANIPGADLKNVFVLRTIIDANTINGQINENTHVVILGVSFIGMEAASFCVKRAAKTTVIGRDSYPLRAFGKEVGERMQKFFEEQNVEFVMKNGIKEIIGNSNGEVESVILNDGNTLKADVVIMGVGTTLNTEFLKESGININTNGSIDTDDYLQSNIPDIYVGGDIANAPIFMTGHRETIGHYGLAQSHGKVAALNMCDKREKLKVVPFFWTMVFGRSLRYAGHGKPKETIIKGSLDDMKFVAFYIGDDDKVIALSTCNRDPIASQFAEYLSQGKTLTKSQIENEPYEWTKNIH